MRPGFIQLNSADVSLANAEHIGEFLLGEPGRPNISDIILRKLSVIVLFALFVVGSVSAFLHHIFHVFCMSPHRKMGRIDARRVVARMHDLHSDGNHGLVFKHPRNSVSHIHFPSIMDSKKSLAFFVFSTDPQPTIRGQRYFNFIPKTAFKDFVKHGVYKQRELEIKSS